MGDTIVVFEFVGFLFCLACAFVGAYVWMRWGYCGVALLWQKREEFDHVVQYKATRTWIRNSR
jgi:hypothetical protein